MVRFVWVPRASSQRVAIKYNYREAYQNCRRENLKLIVEIYAAVHDLVLVKIF